MNLANSVASPRSGLITSDSTYRKYRAVLSSYSLFNGLRDNSHKPIVYEVGRRHSSLKDALVATADSVETLDMSVKTNDAYKTDFTGLARRYSNFSGEWAHMDLSGVVERLAKAVAAHSVFGEVTTDTIRAGQPISVVALGTMDSPVSATTATVFIPRLADGVAALDVFNVLVAAVNGEGGTVATDVLAVNARNGAPVLKRVRSDGIAASCVEALRILGANYESAGAGSEFAYALTRGIHQVVSVVGHTDEGGFMRAVFRAHGFGAPFGGIRVGGEPYVGLPSLANNTPAAVSAWVDGIALKSAALVAHCDPCVSIDGESYPSVYTARGACSARPGTNEPGTDADATAIGSAIASDAPRFSSLYIPGLAALFGLSGGGTAASRHLEACLTAPSTRVDRHLKYKSVAPFYWVEPTSLLPHDFCASQAEASGFGSVVTRAIERTLPAWERVEPLGLPGEHAMYLVKMRSARTSGLMLHLAGHRDNGLGSIRIRQADPNTVVHPGPGNVKGETVEARFDRAAPISELLWTRGQSGVLAPAEAMNVHPNYAVSVLHATWDDESTEMLLEHVPSPFEFGHATVTFTVTAPSGIPGGPLGHWDAEVARERTSAARALSQARLRSGRGPERFGAFLPLSHYPPAFSGSGVATYAPAAPEEPPAPSTGLTQYGLSAARSASVEAHGRPLGPTVHHGAVTGPSPVRGSEQRVVGVPAPGGTIQVTPELDNRGLIVGSVARTHGDPLPEGHTDPLPEAGAQ